MTIERKFDRIPQFDPRSREFPIRTLVGDRALRSYTWNGAPHLDQGVEGACVGFGWTHEAGARPVVRAVTKQDAFDLYRRAQQLDAWPGEAYDGTSVLAGAKAAQEKGWLGEYRWAFSLTDLLLAVGYKGPVVIGVNWYEGMMDTDHAGFIAPTGDIVGGHCTLVKGVSVRNKTVRIHNSWGPSWGVNGDAFLSFDGLDYLLKQQGEACIAIQRF